MRLWATGFNVYDGRLIAEPQTIHSIWGVRRMKLRQVALVAADLKPVADALQDVFGLGDAFDDPGVGEFGLCNAVFPIGDTFLEVVCPKQDGTTAGRYLERRKGDGGYMAIFQTDDAAAEKKRMAELGVNIVWEADYEEAKGLHLHPRDVGGAIVSLDVMKPVESWKWGGPGWEDRSRSDITAKIVGVEVQSADPEKLAKRWAEVLNSKAETEGSGFRVALDNDTYARIVPARDDRGDGISGVDLAVADKGSVLTIAQERNLPCDDDCVTVCGTNFYLK